MRPVESSRLEVRGRALNEDVWVEVAETFLGPPGKEKNKLIVPLSAVKESRYPQAVDRGRLVRNLVAARGSSSSSVTL